MIVPNKPFARRLRALREERNLSVRTLAKLVGVSYVSVWKWETGEAFPQTRNLRSLAKALDVPFASLSSIAKSRAALVGKLDQTDAMATSVAALVDVIERAKYVIAEASGKSVNEVSIMIEF